MPTLPEIPSRVLLGIRAHAEDTTPFECCGVVTADMQVHRMTNAARNRLNSFEFLQRELRGVDRYRGIAGVYHSHVEQDAYLSDLDIAGMPLNNCLYLIAAVRKGVCTQIRCWYRNHETFIEVKL